MTDKESLTEQSACLPFTPQEAADFNTVAQLSRQIAELNASSMSEGLAKLASPYGTGDYEGESGCHTPHAPVSYPTATVGPWLSKNDSSERRFSGVRWSGRNDGSQRCPW